MQGYGFNPWSRKIPHAARQVSHNLVVVPQLLSLNALEPQLLSLNALEPQLLSLNALEPVLCSKRSLQ